LETREDYRDDFRFYYKVILPVDGFRHGVFVEMRLPARPRGRNQT
jgi:hypothetical protein